MAENATTLIAKARITLGDADRCVSLGISPSTGTLHRRLREVTDALEVATEVMRLDGESFTPTSRHKGVKAERDEARAALEAAEAKLDAVRAELRRALPSSRREALAILDGKGPSD